MSPKLLQPLLLLLLLGAAALIGLLRRDGADTSSPPQHDDLPTLRTPAPTRTTPSDPRPTAEAPPPHAVSRPGVGFRSRAQLVDHFDRHGREFGAASAADYLRLAQALRDAPRGGAVVESVRATDGVVTRFDRRTGAFLAFNRDGTIRTFFRPDDGEAYYRRQLDRTDDRP